MPAPRPNRFPFSMEPAFFNVFWLSLIACALVLSRPLLTSFVFDEQEALLANPYLNGAAGADFWSALKLDFWGLPAESTIGSYRPLPNLLWRTLSASLRLQTPFFFLLLNWLVHALTTAMTVQVLRMVMARENGKGLPVESNLAAWFCAIFFSVCALSTEAVTSAVGLADLLVGACTISALWASFAFAQRIAEGAIVPAITFWGVVFFCVLLGWFSKETMAVSLLMLLASPILALWLPAISFRNRLTSGRKAWILGGSMCAVGSASLLYFAARRSWFGAQRAPVDLHVPQGPFSGTLREIFQLTSQPILPHDFTNNPLFGVESTRRWATASEIFLEQSLQVLFPFHLVGDYSFPRLVPTGWGLWAALGGLWVLLLVLVVLTPVLTPIFKLAFAGAKWPSRATGLVARLGGTSSALWAFWILCSGALLGNALILLPTIRADRLVYSTTIAFAIWLSLIVQQFRAQDAAWFRRAMVVFLAFQIIQARVHSLHYRNDLAFWTATSAGNPPSAKSLLNRGIMLGARGDSESRVRYARMAVELAPQWAMGQIYLGDALCRTRRAKEARKPYLEGLAHAAERKGLTALALQCIWEMGAYQDYRPALLTIADAHPDSWLAFFLRSLDEDGTQNRGIPEEYRPRKYNSSR